MRLVVKSLSKSFEENKVLSDISFALEPGNITALVGRNGSGKTTLLRILANILDADQGLVLLNEESIKNKIHLQENIAYLPDRFDYFKYDTIQKGMEYYRVIYKNFDREFCIKELGKLKIDPKTPFVKLSKGNKALVGLIMTLATKAKVLLLDEILDGMDVLNRKHVYSYLIEAAEEGRTLMVSSHELEDLQGLSNAVLYLSIDGKMTQMNMGGDMDIKKYQLVTPSFLSDKIEKNSLKRFHIGRVHTVLVEGAAEEWEKIFEEEGIIQFDRLPLKIEDLFYWEQGKESVNE